MTKTKNNISVTSEIGTLRRLLVHSPDSGLGKVVPSKAQDWLFEDIVHLDTIRRKEYDYYTKILLYFLDPSKIIERPKRGMEFDCVIATDATLAGRPASALPGGPAPITVFEQLFGGQFLEMASKESIDQAIQAAGRGARGIVYGERTGGVSHVFNVINQRGLVRYLDGQTGLVALFTGYTRLHLLKTN